MMSFQGLNTDFYNNKRDSIVSRNENENVRTQKQILPDNSGENRPHYYARPKRFGTLASDTSPRK